jgi:hypothetical protein
MEFPCRLDLSDLPVVTPLPTVPANIAGLFNGRPV